MKKFEFNKEAKSNLAKLLATENLTVEHRKVKTAYFDLQKRLLVVPIWKEMNVDILDLLLAHEIGHALFTPQVEWKEAIDKKIPHSFLNVVEDARIEKLIKRKYPGLSQSFIKGYRDLIANDFFKTADKDINEMLLIDRLNMHFKTSHVESIIEFVDDVELEFVDRMAKLETFAEVEVLAKDLAEYCKGESELKSLDDHEFETIFGDDGDDGDELSDSANGDESLDEAEENESDESSKNKSPHSNKKGEDGEDGEDGDEGDEKGKSEDFNDNGNQSDIVDEGVAPGDRYPSSETDDAWNQNQNHLLDEKSKDNIYYHVHEFKNLNEYVFDYKRTLQDFRDDRNIYVKGIHSHYKKAWSMLVADYKKFQKNQGKAVNYMVKEFELKKAATAHSRSLQSNSGVVDPLKLHSYKFNDDIFKRLTITPDGKNHGLMMFIDWSGSMTDKLTPTIHQLMNLTMFCRKVQIPFEVYAFSNNQSYNNSRDSDGIFSREYPKPDYQNGDITVDNRLVLLNLISSKMTAKEYDEGMTNLYFLATRYGYDPYAYRYGRNFDIDAYKAQQWKDDLHSIPIGYNLSSTPLNDSIMAAMKMVPAFQRKYNIDKMNTVFLTDGASDGGQRIVITDPDEIKEGQSQSSDGTFWSSRRGQDGLHFKDFNSWDTNQLITDRFTKKTFKVEDKRVGLTDSLLKILKLRTGTKVLGFFISEKKTIEKGVLNVHFPENDYWNPGCKLYDRKKVMAEFRKNKVLVVTENTGYDELYLLAGGSMNVSDSHMATPSEDAKKGEIKRLFAGSLKSNHSSRVVLNKFISQVA
jgi:hypothetical protein